MNSRNWTRFLRTCACTQTMALLVLILGGALFTYGQQITATIVGTVTDQNGAVVPAATVKATNTATGFSRSMRADGVGAYHIEFLPIGSYTVVVDAPGFKKFVQQNLVLTVDAVQTLNVSLAVGAENQTVTVTEAPPLVETSTAELGRTVSPAEIISLPLVNRNAYAEDLAHTGRAIQQRQRAEQSERHAQLPGWRTGHGCDCEWQHRRRQRLGQLLP